MEKQSVQSKSHSKMQYNTLLSKFIHFIWTLFLISLMAWIGLMVWFGIHLTNQLSLIVSSCIELIQKNNGDLISKQASSIILQFHVQFHEAVILAQSYTLALFDYLKLALKSSHYSNHLFTPASDEITKAITAMIFNTFEMVIDRLFIFILYWPFMLTLLFVMAVDGLGQRDIRKFQGARESTFFFHRIKPFTASLFYFGFFMYLIFPFYISPVFFMVPLGLLVSVMVMLSVKSYKKYV